MKEGIEKNMKKVDFSGAEDKDREVKMNEKEIKSKDKEIKSSEPSKKKGKEIKPPTKVVVRRLPPSMTEEEFLQQIDPLPPVDFMYYVQADNSLAPNNFCRAYLNFVNQSDIFIFTQKFDNYVFVDAKGSEYPAVVEFAPFQRIPKQRQTRKKDSKCSTLSSDPFYMSFLEKLETEAQEMTSANNNAKQHFFETNMDSNEDTKVSSTPLLDFLHTRFQERRRLREEKRKKDLERKKAKEDIKKAAKKTEDETPSSVKVLHGQSANKEKLKDKENSRTAANKKRNDERVKEYKTRIGKSYQEEKQKQLERREEQKRKLASTKTQKPTSDDKRKEDREAKDDEDDGDVGEDDAQETGSKVVEEDHKKDSSEKLTSSHPKNYSQKFQEERVRREEEKRRMREERALKRKEERERREERYKNKKPVGTEKKSYEYSDKYKERQTSSSSGYKRSQSINSYATDRKVKNSRTLKTEGAADCSSNEKTVRKQSENEVDVEEKTVRKRSENEVDVEEKSKETKVDGVVVEDRGKDDREAEGNGDDLKSKDSECNRRLDNIVPENDANDTQTGTDCSNNNDKSHVEGKNVSNKIESSNNKVGNNTKDNEDVSDRGDNLDNHISHLDLETTASCGDCQNKGIEESSSKLELESFNTTRDHDTVELSEEKKQGRKSVKYEGEDEKVEDEKHTNVNCDEDVAKKMNETEVEVDSRLKHITEKKISNFLLGEEKKEEGIKRRNSMEMYDDGKEENSEKLKRRESGRRNSLESGDKKGPLKSLGDRDQEKDSGDSKERLKEQSEDPRMKRRIRNKDRPSMEIYRPGMGRFSKQRLEKDKVGSSTEVDSPSPSPSPTPISKHRHNSSGSQSRAA